MIENNNSKEEILKDLANLQEENRKLKDLLSKTTGELKKDIDEKLRFAMKISQTGIWDLDLSNFTVFRSIEHDMIFGYSEFVPDWTYQTFLEHVYPEDLKIVEGSFEISVNNQSDWNFECRIIRKDSSIRWIRVSARHSFDEITNTKHLAGIVHDITESKQAFELIKQRELKFSKVFNTCPEPLAILELSNNTYVEVNEAYLNVLGYSREEVIAHTPADIKVWPSPEDRERYIQALSKNGDIKKMEFRFRMKNGELKDFLVSSAIVDLEGIKYSINFIVDISVRKKAEDDLYEKNMELERQYEEYMQLNETLRNTNYDMEIAISKAEESDKLKTAFLQNMSHEIRTPLNGILGFSKLLQNEKISKADINDFTDIIQQSGNRLLEIVNNILDISKIETGQINVEYNGFSINTLLSDLLQFFTPIANSKNIKLVFQNKYPKLSLIYSDESKINQILTNLINNAIKFTDNGKIDFGYEIQNNDLLFFVADTGLGISEEKFDKIFDRFIQIDMKISRGYEGVGLGLAICKGLVELLGGIIWLQSRIGEGTTFYFTIPLSVSDSLNDFGINKGKENINLRKSKILIVEDDLTSYRYLSRILSDIQSEHLHAENGKIAVELVDKYPDINIILMDIRMPVMDGIESTRIIRQSRPDLPIIAQTAYAFSEEKKRILSLGFDEYISKPIEINELTKILNKFLN